MKEVVIAMSSLFERSQGTLAHSLVVPRHLELRQIPYISQDGYNRVLFSGTGAQSGVPGRIMTSMFTNAQTNWMYSATIQLTLDGFEPPWSKDGWSFWPVSLPDLPRSSNASYVQDIGSDTLGTLQPLAAANFTMTTTATRGRLECDNIPELGNTSTWLRQTRFRQFPNSTQGVKAPIRTAYEVTPNMFRYNYTSLLTHPGLASCCIDTSKNQTQSIAIGYWSSTGDIQWWPNADVPWPMNVTIKWLRGLATPWPADTEFLKHDTNNSDRGRSGYMFTDVPSLQAINCRPLIESAAVDVTVDYATGVVQEFHILEEPKPDLAPWSDPFVTRTWNYKDDPRLDNMWINVETSTRYVELFHLKIARSLIAWPLQLWYFLYDRASWGVRSRPISRHNNEDLRLATTDEG
jgi:hypothetical protein